MAKWENIWGRARTQLTLVGERGEEDVFLWEHSARVTRTALAIAALPEVSPRSPDHTLILVAGLFHDAGWAVRVREGECRRNEVLCRTSSALQREAGIKLMEQSLDELVAQAVIDRAALVIRALSTQDISLLEGQILSDAENLEEVGISSLWAAVRRGALEGRGVQAALDQWKRRREYQFWTSRLKDGFRIAAVRNIAAQRLATYDRFMEVLQVQQECGDLPAPAPETVTIRS